MIAKLRGLASLIRLSLVTRSPLRFLYNQARRRPDAGYELREGGLVLFVRHGTPDVSSLEQVFRQGHNVPPPDALRILHRLRPLRAVDLGANIGAFGAWLLGTFPGAHVTAVEADPETARIHRRAVDTYHGPGRWELIEAIAATSADQMRFRTGQFGTSRLAAPGEEGTMLPSLDAFRWLDVADFIKIDIEGAEWDVLADNRFRRIPAACIGLEYHAERCPGPEPRREAVRGLQEAGYAWCDASFEAPEGHGMIWAWKDS